MHESGAYQTAELAAAYDALYEYVDDAHFWTAMAVIAGGGRILELGCGTGRVLIPLAEEGYEVTGVDLSPAMLERCRAKLAESPASVRERVSLIEGDMASFEDTHEYSAVFCPFNSFHHLRTVEAQLECLGRCHDRLVPHGTLVLDLFNPDPAPSDHELGHTGGPASAGDTRDDADVVEMADGRSLRRWMSRCEYVRAQQCNECEMTYEITGPDGAVRSLHEVFPMRLIYRYELEHLLARTGFRLLELYGGYDRSPFAEESIGMIAVASRQG